MSSARNNPCSRQGPVPVLKQGHWNEVHNPRSALANEPWAINGTAATTFLGKSPMMLRSFYLLAVVAGFYCSRLLRRAPTPIW